MRKTVLGGLLASTMLSLGGCLTVGQDFPVELRWLEIGKTRRDEVDKRLGPPFRMGRDSGLFAYTYLYYRYSLVGKTMTKDLVVRFGPDLVVKDYSFASSFPEDKMTIDPENKPKAP